MPRGAKQRPRAPPDRLPPMRLKFTYWPSVSATTKREITLPWAEMPDFIRRVGTQQMKKACPLVKLAVFGDIRTSAGSLRHDNNVLAVTGVELDYDGKQMPLAEALERLERHQVKALLYPSWSHDDEAPRWRVLAPLSQERPPAERLRYAECLNGILGGVMAKESAVLSQSYFVGWPPNREPRVYTTFEDPDEGSSIDELDDLDMHRVPFANTPQAPAERADAPGQHPDHLARLLTGEDLHRSALRLVGRLVGQGVDPKLIRAMFEGLASQLTAVRPQERVDELLGGELDRMISGCLTKGYQTRGGPDRGAAVASGPLAGQTVRIPQALAAGAPAKLTPDEAIHLIAYFWGTGAVPPKSDLWPCILVFGEFRAPWPSCAANGKTPDGFWGAVAEYLRRTEITPVRGAMTDRSFS